MKPLIASEKEVTRGQKEECVNLITSAFRKAAGMAIDELVGRGVLNRVNIEKVRARGNEVVAAITALAKKQFAEIAENIVGIVKLISGAETLELDETDGKATIAEAKDIFNVWIDPDFKDYCCDVKPEPTKKIQVSVYEVIQDGTSAKIWNSISYDLKSLCLTQAQIIQFVVKHRKWLCTGRHGTFFLFKVGYEFFVANVNLDGKQLLVYMEPFSSDNVWYFEDHPRIVVPNRTSS